MWLDSRSYAPCHLPGMDDHATSLTLCTQHFTRCWPPLLCLSFVSLGTINPIRQISSINPDLLKPVRSSVKSAHEDLSRLECHTTCLHVVTVSICSLSSVTNCAVPSSADWVSIMRKYGQIRVKTGRGLPGVGIGLR